MPITRIAGSYQERWSRAAWWSRRLAVFALTLGVVAIIAHRLVMVNTSSFLWVLAVVFGLAMAALLFAAAGFQRVWYFGDRGGADLAVAILLGLLIVTPFAAAGWWAYTAPELSDVSTDPDDPPQLRAAGTFRTPDMNAVAPPTVAERAAQLKAYPELTGRRYAVPFDLMTAAVETLVDRHGWQIVSPMASGSEVELTLEALVQMPILALPYDVAVRITDEGNASYVDMRSASRFGRRDGGINAARIAAFLAELDTQASLLTTPVPATDQ